MTTQEETWRPVVGYGGYYEVSDLGRVRSLDRMVRHGRGSGEAKRAGRVLRIKRQSDGRRIVILSRDGARRTMRVSTLVLEAFVGSRPPGLVACHNDGDHTRNHLDNLRWDTQSENLLDQQRHGTCVAKNRTHCPRGHLLRQPNLVASTFRKGYRTCLCCARARAAQQHAKTRGERFDFEADAHARYADIMGARCPSPLVQSSCMSAKGST